MFNNIPVHQKQQQ